MRRRCLTSFWGEAKKGTAGRPGGDTKRERETEATDPRDTFSDANEDRMAEKAGEWEGGRERGVGESGTTKA